uniref:Uncharacterized protein n=1 Tax=Rhizophora mucronata TaxID=61149 RepID=A0A2P2MQ90_RHIMU
MKQKHTIKANLILQTKIKKQIIYN